MERDETAPVCCPEFALLNYLAHPVTNALTEGFDSRIQAIKVDTRGFHSFTNYLIRILFHYGKLDLRPTLTPQS